MKEIKKYLFNFSKYFSVGLFATALNIFFSWLFIDVIGMKAIVSSTIIVVTLFLFKYKSYTGIKLIQKKLRIFLFISISSLVLYVFFTALLIDVLLIPTLIAVPFTTIVLFFLRFFAFYWTKMIMPIKDPEKKANPKNKNQNKNKEKINVPRNQKILAITIFLLLISITLSTQYIGSVDTDSFTSVSKYFAGSYQAGIRSSHSLLLGFINSPYVSLTGSLISFKIINLFVLALLILSVYSISNKNKKAFILMLLSPIVWYMSPWINSIQISSLFFLWCYYFIEKYDKSNKTNELFYSGIFFGLAAAFWHAIFFFGFFFIIIYFYNKETYHSAYYLVAIIIGLIPLLILDSFLYTSPFHSLLKNVMGTTSNFFGLGVYSKQGVLGKNILDKIILLVIIPLYFWMLYKPKNLKNNLKPMLFLTTSLIIITVNSQIRFLLLIIPIMVLLLGEIANKKQLKRLIIYSIIISLIIVVPYLIQIKYNTNCAEFGLLIKSFPNCKINQVWPQETLALDLNQISKEYPNEIFIVGNHPDDYQILANIYWDKNIKEFVSIQDYNLFLQNTSIIVEREFKFSPKNINDRREIWIKGGIGKPVKEDIAYSKINYGLSTDSNFEIGGFKLIKSYKVLNLFKKQ